MKSIYDIRSDNLKALRATFSLQQFPPLLEKWEASDRKDKKPRDSDAAFALSLGMNPRLYSQLKNGKHMGPEVARKIEEKRSLESGWMDHDHTPSLVSDITQLLGAWAFREPSASDYSRARPAIYLERIEESNLAPRIQAGEYIACLKAHCEAGSDVLVELANGQRLIKRLVYQRGDELAFEAVNSKGGRLLCRTAEIRSMQLIIAILPFKDLPA